MNDARRDFLKRPEARYGLAVVAVTAGYLVRLALGAAVGEGLPTYITFYPAVILVALLAGLGPGLLATVLILFLVDYLMLGPGRLLGHEKAVDTIGLALFAFMSGCICAMAELYRRARDRAARYENDWVAGSGERRRAELAVTAERQRFRQVLDRLPAYLVLLAPDYRVPFANRFFEERFGAANGRRCYEYLFNRSEPCENCETYKVLKTWAPHEWEWTGPDGHIYEIHDSPFTDVDGSPLILEVGLDITGRKAAEREHHKLRDELARVSRITTAGQLAASLAHELNQPLGAIACNAQAVQQLLAQQPPVRTEVREALEDIEADTHRAGAVIQQLRGLYQKTGKARTALHLNDLLLKTTDLLRSEFVLRAVEVRSELDARLPSIQGNGVELQQVVLNLVTNAVEAMGACPAGTRKLLIRTTCDERRNVVVSVRDSGPGVAEAQLRRVFDPFYTTKATGMGMGLAISRSIVEAHGGRLWAENNPEGGATFRFSLPAASGNSS